MMTEDMAKKDLKHNLFEIVKYVITHNLGLSSKTIVVI